MSVDFGKKRAMVTASRQVSEGALVNALKKAGFGGKLLETKAPKPKKKEPPETTE